MHHTHVPVWRRSFATLASGLLALASSSLFGQSTINYTAGQIDTTARSISAPNNPTTLDLTSGRAIQSGVLSGTGSLIKTGAGTLALTGNNLFTGPIAVNGGALELFHQSNLGTSSNPVTLNGGTLLSTGIYLANPLQIDGTGTINTASGRITVLNGPLTGSGTVTKSGPGTVSLINGTGNTFSGNLILSPMSGILAIGALNSGSSTSGGALPGLTSASTITINTGSSVQILDSITGNSTGYLANRFGTEGDRPNVDLAGGTIFLNGANIANTVTTQTFGHLSASSEASTVSVTRNSSGTPTLVFSDLAQSRGSYLSFSGTNLGTAAANVGRILFTTAPTLVGGGGAAGSTNISILPGARVGNELATYGAYGVRALTAAEYNSVANNDVNTAGTTENVKFAATVAPAALSSDKTINSLTISGSTALSWNMGAKTLTLTSGQLLHGGSANLNLTGGSLTAGTGAAGAIDLNLTSTSANVVVGASLTDNASTVVTVVKSGLSLVALAAATGSTYTGGTVVNEGVLTTGNTAGTRYLGAGSVLINGASGAASTQLSLGSSGATSFAGSRADPTYTLKSRAQLQLSNTAPASNEFFKIESGSVLSLSGSTVAAGLDLDTNLNAAPGAVLAQRAAEANVALRKGGVAITTALTTPTYLFGLDGNLSENITLGTGTPWLGLSNGRASSTYTGGSSNNTLTANSDFTLQSYAGNTASILTLGNGAHATNIVKIATPNSDVVANVVGLVRLNNDNSQYGSANHTVTFAVSSGSTLTATTANAQGVIAGDATAPAAIVVQNGGNLAIGNAAALNGSVTLLPGAQFTHNQSALTGTGTITHSNGSILNVTTSTTAVSGATQNLGTVAGTIVRLGVTNPGVGTSTNGITQFDSRLHDAAVFEVTISPLIFGNAGATSDTLLTLSAENGIGGVLTNDASSRTLAAATGLIAIGPGGGTLAATTGTTFTVSENISLGANTLTIGSAQSYLNNPKLGTVSLLTGSNNITGASGSVISVISGATLRYVSGNQVPDVTRLTVSTGGTVNLNAVNDTMESLSGAGTVTNSGANVSTLTLVPTTTDANFSGVLNATTAANLALVKNGTGTQTLSGASTYAGGTTINAGKLVVNNTTGSATGTGTVTVNSGATLAGTGFIGGVTTLNTGATLAPGNSPGTLTINSDAVWNGGATYAWEINNAASPATSAGTNYDLVSISGTLTLNATAENPFTLSLVSLLANNTAGDVLNFNAGVNSAYVIASAAGGIIGFDANAFTINPTGFTNALTGGSWSLALANSNKDLQLNFTAAAAAIPEPSTYAAMFGLTALALALYRKRRRT